MTPTNSDPQRYRGFILTSVGLQKLNDCIQKLEAQTRIRYSATAIARKVQLAIEDGIHPITVRKILQCRTGVDLRSINHVFQALQLSLNEGDYAHANLCKSNKSKWTSVLPSNYNNIPDISNFYGRTKEIAQLEYKIICDRSKVVACAGMLGIGKTATAIKLAHSLKQRFEFVIWKSLRQAPTLEEILIGVIRNLSSRDDDRKNFPNSLYSLIDLFIEKLQRHRCLLILDGFEVVMSNYGGENQAYIEFLQIFLENKHQSTLVLTSREKPRIVGLLSDKDLYSIQLTSLQFDDVKQIFNQQGNYQGSQEDWINLVNYYGGNPLVLKMVANRILRYFGGNISEYLKELVASRFILHDFSRLFGEEFQNISKLEQLVMQKLASYSSEVSLLQLRQDLNEPPIEAYLLDILDSLNSRGFFEKCGADFKLQPFVAECVRNIARK
ncbi:MAG: NB-ARC domain-containing protein [Cyanobacteria bacterium J06635_10]